MTGYIFNFQRGAYSPEGKVAEAISQSQIDAHNRRLAQAEIEAMKQTGRAVLYLHKRADGFHVGSWDGSQDFSPWWVSFSRHNIGRTRTDVWFNFDGATWHGVNIGNNDLVRCKRTKGAR